MPQFYGGITFWHQKYCWIQPFLLEQSSAFATIGFGVFGRDDHGCRCLAVEFERPTPIVARPATRTDFMSMRMILPNYEIIIISVTSPTSWMLATLSYSASLAC
jgi:hypothetical protein